MVASRLRQCRRGAGWRFKRALRLHRPECDRTRVTRRWPTNRFPRAGMSRLATASAQDVGVHCDGLHPTPLALPHHLQIFQIFHNFFTSTHVFIFHFNIFQIDPILSRPYSITRLSFLSIMASIEAETTRTVASIRTKANSCDDDKSTGSIRTPSSVSGEPKPQSRDSELPIVNNVFYNEETLKYMRIIDMYKKLGIGKDIELPRVRFCSFCH
jgi:hypothetical protein